MLGNGYGIISWFTFIDLYNITIYIVSSSIDYEY